MQYFYWGLVLQLAPLIDGRPFETGEVANLTVKETREVPKEEVVQTNEDTPGNENIPDAEETKPSPEPKEVKIAEVLEDAVPEVTKQSVTIKAELLIAPANDVMLGQEEISKAIYLEEKAKKLQFEGRNVTIGLFEEKNINGEEVKVFSDGSKEIVVRDNSLDFKLSLLCLAVVGILLFIVYSYCLY